MAGDKGTAAEFPHYVLKIQGCGNGGGSTSAWGGFGGKGGGGGGTQPAKTATVTTIVIHAAMVFFMDISPQA